MAGAVPGIIASRMGSSISAPTISFVGSMSSANSSTLPAGWAPGDIAIVFSYRRASSTPPTLPAGWTNITNAGANTNSFRLAYRILQAGDASTTSWVNATSVVGGVYRCSSTWRIGGFSVFESISTTTIQYLAVTMQRASVETAWVLGFAGGRQPNVSSETPPTGMINRTFHSVSDSKAAIHDTTAAVTSWSATSVAGGGTSDRIKTVTIELIAE